MSLISTDDCFIDVLIGLQFASIRSLLMICIITITKEDIMLSQGVITFVLTQLFGVYIIVMSIVLFIRAQSYRKLVQNMNPESGTIVLAGAFGLLLGIFFVGIHNLWVLEGYVLITMLCWLILIFSLLLLFVPELMVIWLRKLVLSRAYYFLIAFMIIFGFACVGKGMYMYVLLHTKTGLFNFVEISVPSAFTP